MYTEWRAGDFLLEMRRLGMSAKHQGWWLLLLQHMMANDDYGYLPVSIHDPDSKIREVMGMDKRQFLRLVAPMADPDNCQNAGDVPAECRRYAGVMTKKGVLFSRRLVKDADRLKLIKEGRSERARHAASIRWAPKAGCHPHPHLQPKEAGHTPGEEKSRSPERETELQTRARAVLEELSRKATSAIPKEAAARFLKAHRSNPESPTIDDGRVPGGKP